MKKLSLVMGALLPMLFFVSTSQAVEIDRVVAIVGPDVITLSELQGEMAPALSQLKQRYDGEDTGESGGKAKEGDRQRPGG